METVQMLNLEPVVQKLKIMFVASTVEVHKMSAV